MGRSVLVIDTDPQANATIGLGVYPESVQKNIYHYYISHCSDSKSGTLLSDYIIKTISGVDLIASHLDLVGAEAVLYQNPDRYYILSTGINQIKNRYDHILIDTPPFLGQFMMNGMIAADHLVMVFSPDTFAIAGYDHLTMIIQDISEILGKKVRISLAILNRWGAPLGKPETLSEKIYDFFGLKKNHNIDSLNEIRTQLETRIRVEIPEVVIVHEGKEISQSNKQGIPLIVLAPDDPAVQGFKAASQIIDTLKPGGA